MEFNNSKMKIYNLCLYISMLSVFISCNRQQSFNYEYSKEETEQFLDDIVRNAKVSIGDITEIKKEPTDKLYFYTRCVLTKEKLEEYNKNDGTLINKDNDISDFTTYIVKDYELISENNEKLQIVDKGRANSLQEYGLWENNTILYQNLGIEIQLNKNYKKLKGNITIEFEMPRKEKREIKIPVNITIYDKLSE